MKPPSPAALRLVDELVDRRGGGLRELDEQRALQVLRSLEERWEPAVIPYLAALVLSVGGAGGGGGRIRSLMRRQPAAPGRERVADAAGDLIASFLSRARVRDLPALEERVRAALLPRYDSHRSRVRSLSELRRAPQHRRVTTALVSWHRNGYLRESAVRELARAGDGDELPYLILRLNDWVEPVREAARAAVLARIQPGRCEQLVRCLPLISRLERLTRVDNREITERVLALLRAPSSLGPLLQGLEQRDAEVRAAALEHLLEHEAAPWDSILWKLSRDENVHLRLSSMNEPWTRAPSVARALVFDHLRDDPHPGVRLRALRLFIHECIDDAPAELHRALFDRAASVRHLARFHLRLLTGEQDFAAFYRAELAGAPARLLPIVVSGLAETGKPEDVAHIRPFLRHERSPVVRAALHALHRLDPVGTREVLRTFLWDARRGVSNTAARLMSAELGVGDLGVLTSAMRAGPPHARRAVVRLARSLEPWHALPLLTSGSPDADEELREAVSAALNATVHAYRHALYVPRRATPSERRQLEDNLASIGCALPAELVSALRGIVDEERAGP